jgi:RNA polymerase sigma-70 factor (ECF subfamily)
MTIERGACLEAIELVYRGQFHRFLHVASAITCDTDSGADAVQEAFASAVRHRHGFRGEGPLEAWLWRLVVNSARRHVRRQADIDHSMDNSGLDTVISARSPHATAADRRLHAAALRVLMGRLPERQRLVLFLRYYADLDYKAIAAALDISPGTVGATLNAAHASLRLRVDEEVAL